MAQLSKHADDVADGADSGHGGSTRFAVLDVVRLERARPGDGLPGGATGTIVEVFDRPEPAYEVEFLDDAGEFIAEIPVHPEDLTLVHRPSTKATQ